MGTGLGLLEDVIADDATVAEIPSDLTYDEIAQAVTWNYWQFRDDNEPLITNQQFARRCGKDKGNLSRALKARLDPETFRERYTVLAHLRGLQMTEGVDPEELSTRGLRGYLNGIASLPSDRRKNIAERATANRNTKVPYLGCSFDSAPEAVCASFLKDGIKDLKFRRNRTYQRPVRNPITDTTLRFDFAIPRGLIDTSHLVLIEYHEPIIWSQDGKGHFETEDEARTYRDELSRLSGAERREREDEVGDLLFRRWLGKRKDAIAANPRYRGTPLLAARNRHEFYTNVLHELGIASDNETAFNAKFRRRLEEMNRRRMA